MGSSVPLDDDGPGTDREPGQRTPFFDRETGHRVEVLLVSRLLGTSCRMVAYRDMVTMERLTRPLREWWELIEVEGAWGPRHIGEKK